MAIVAHQLDNLTFWTLQVLSRLILIVWLTVGRLAAVTQKKMLTLKGALDTGPKWVGSGRRLRGVPIGERRPFVLKWVAAEVHRLRGKIRDASCQGGQPPICWIVTAATT